MKLLFFIFFSNIIYSQNFIKELSEKTVGKFLYDKNIEINNDTLDIYIRVNSKGFCFAVDVLTNSKTKVTLGENQLKKLIGRDMNWVRNDTIISQSLIFDEYQSFGDYLSQRGRNHRYDNYFEHAQVDEIIYLLLYTASDYAILVEPANTEFLTFNEDNSIYKNSISNESIFFNSIHEANLFLNSDEVKNKGIELQNIQNEIIRKHNEMNLIDISSIELPYKVRLGMTELEFEKHLMSLFGNFKKEVQDEISYREAIKKGIYKKVEYNIKYDEAVLRLEIKLFYNKLFHIGYSHFDNNLSEIDELDFKIKEKLKLIKNEYNLLFEINTQYDNKIWSLSEKEKFEQEEQILMNSIYEAKKQKQNSIENKM